MDVDFEKVAALLAVVSQCAGHSGKLGAISNAAMAELMTLNGKIKEDAVKAKEDEAKAAQTEETVDEEETDEGPVPTPTNGRRI